MIVCHPVWNFLQQKPDLRLIVPYLKVVSTVTLSKRFKYATKLRRVYSHPTCKELKCHKSIVTQEGVAGRINNCMKECATSNVHGINI
jgi:hypothetical protein